jgi:hypothetical protein
MGGAISTYIEDGAMGPREGFYDSVYGPHATA